MPVTLRREGSEAHRRSAFLGLALWGWVRWAPEAKLWRLLPLAKLCLHDMWQCRQKKILRWGGQVQRGFRGRQRDMGRQSRRQKRRRATSRS